MICQAISHLYHCPAGPWSDQNNKIGDNCIIFLKYLTNILKYKQSVLSYLHLRISKMRFIKTLLHNSKAVKIIPSLVSDILHMFIIVSPESTESC